METLGSGKIERSIDNLTDDKFPASTFQNSNLYAYKYFFCEILNLINVLCQIIFTDYFLEGQFLLYGFQRKKVFPNMSKWTFFKYGYSGSVEKLDSLCLLAMNLLNEKVHIFLSYWLIFFKKFFIIHMCNL